MYRGITILICTLSGFALGGCRDDGGSEATTSVENGDSIGSDLEGFHSNPSIDDDGVTDFSPDDLVDGLQAYAMWGDIGTARILLICSDAIFIIKGSYFYGVLLEQPLAPGDHFVLYGLPEVPQDPYLSLEIEVLSIERDKIIVNDRPDSDDSFVYEYCRVNEKDSRLAYDVRSLESSIERLREVENKERVPLVNPAEDEQLEE